VENVAGTAEQEIQAGPWAQQRAIKMVAGLQFATFREGAKGVENISAKGAKPAGKP
jgi:hypothetical protein